MTFDDLFGDEEKSPVSDSQPPQGEQTDRVNGEYHYKNGYTQRIYSDAHYVRADETTVPPRYYTPPEKPQKESRAAAKTQSHQFCHHGRGPGMKVDSRLSSRSFSGWKDVI